MYLAHISDDRREQSVEEHLRCTAALAEQFAAEFHSAELGKCCGMLHDTGKYSEEFQKRIRNLGPKVDHSTAGAQILMQKLPNGMGKMGAYCIAGHHAGLPDGGSSSDETGSTLCARLKSSVDPFDPFYKEIDIESVLPKSAPPIRMLMGNGFTYSFFIRMLYSCLVDADFLDTEFFMSGGAVNRPKGKSIEALYKMLQKHLEEYRNPTRDINIERSKILNNCLQKADSEKGLFTMTVPTGGGKTISSLAFALKHAVKHHMKRVIYVIPYTSIIEQTAGEFRHIFGDENVLEHHSNFDYNDEGEKMDPKRLATENWDMPLVVTTNVQFFESLFANKSSRCRKLHNINNSVIIFDEAQMIPLNYLQPCVRAIAELTYNYDCTAVLCSATQPALQGLFPPEIKSREICENTTELYNFFRRVTMKQAGELDDDTLADALNARRQVLCIVNTRKHAQNLYDRLDKEGSFHLSTLMYPAHRKRILDEIRDRLKDGKPCRVVSTSLIEAGVDVDFPAVYRAWAGLDSEIQAAGRCNRENRRPAAESLVVLFQPEEKYRNHSASIQKPIDSTEIAQSKYADITSPEAIRCYFETLYHLSSPEEMDTKEILKNLEKDANALNFPFTEIAKDFQLIEQSTHSVLIPLEEKAAALADRLRAGERSLELLRAVGHYCVNIYDGEFTALRDAGKLECIDNGEISILLDSEAYSEQKGLAVKAESGVAFFG